MKLGKYTIAGTGWSSIIMLTIMRPRRRSGKNRFFKLVQDFHAPFPKLPKL